MAQTFTPEQAAVGFEILPFDMAAIGRSGSGRIEVRVVGYWSRDPIEVRIERDWYSAYRAQRESGVEADPLTLWKVSVSHSSGGRDTDQADDCTASRNFGKALIAAADLACTFDFAVCEAAHVERAAEDQARRDAEEAAKQAAIDADPALGHEYAKSLVELLAALTKQRRTDLNIAVWDRGADDAARNTLCVSTSRSGSVMFRLAGTSYSKADLIKILAIRSVRTNNVVI